MSQGPANGRQRKQLRGEVRRPKEIGEHMDGIERKENSLHLERIKVPFILLRESGVEGMAQQVKHLLCMLEDPRSDP